MKSKDELEALETELFDRLWYWRHTHFPTSWEGVPPDIRAGAATNAQRVSVMYPEAIERDKTDPARLEGWLAAVRWVLDDTAVTTDGYLYDS
jgi:hypothetical protein